MAARSVFANLKHVAANTIAAIDESIGELHFDLGHDCSDTVFLAGSARSGTTWVAELINFDNSYRMIFEPFFPQRVPLCSAFEVRQYLRADDDDPRYLEPAKTILSGRFRNRWADKYNRQPFPHKRLVKEIRGNLLLRWLHSHFPEVPIILLLRHPCAVVGSRLRREWNHYKLRTYLAQDALMSDFLSPFRSDLERASTPLEVHLYSWCIETMVPFRQFKPNEIHVAFYENLRVDPRAEVARLFEFLGRPLEERVFSLMHRPSKRVRLQQPKESGASATSIDDWRRQYSELELSYVRDVLGRFGLESLYGDDGIPNKVAASALFQG